MDCPRGESGSGRRGAIVVLVVLLLPVVLIIAGFSVDCANMQRVRTEMRAVADLSAKAAAAELSRTQNVTKAINAAKKVALANEVAGTSIVLDVSDIAIGRSERQANGVWTFQAGATPPNSFRVSPKRTSGSPNGVVPLFFGSFIGRDSFETQVSATASFLDVDICLVLDRSSSMKLSTSSTAGGMSASDPRFCQAPLADSRWVAVANSVGLFINHLNTTLAKEHVSLVTFSSNYTSSCGEQNLEVTLDQSLHENLSLVTSAMTTKTNTVWNGATNIDAGIRTGRTTLTSNLARDYATKVMVVLTDGVYTGNDPVPEATLAANENIIVHTITFGNGANQTDMQSVASAGNGSHFHAPDVTALNDVFMQIAGAVAILTQ